VAYGRECKRGIEQPLLADAGEAKLTASSPLGGGSLHDQIEFILKIPRSVDPHIAEEINRRHRIFVEQEISRFSLALRDAERLSSECKSSSRRSREDAQESI